MIGCMVFEVNGARPGGRPKRTWREIVEKTVRHVDFTEGMPWIVIDGGNR